MNKEEQRKFVYELYNRCYKISQNCNSKNQYKVAKKYYELAIKKIKTFKGNDFIYYIKCFNDLVKECDSRC